MKGSREYEKTQPHVNGLSQFFTTAELPPAGFLDRLYERYGARRSAAILVKDEVEQTT